MSKEKLSQDVEGLEEVAVEAEGEAKVAKARKIQTPEEKEVLVAGVAQLKSMGVSEEFAKVLDLAIDWNSAEEEKAAAKAATIEAFGASDILKDYIDGDFTKDSMAWSGIAKLMPVVNNIKSFYARRESTATKKVKYVQVSISGVIFNVDSEYAESIKSLPVAERKELLLAHPATNQVSVAEEIF
jgi:hypothetical protein